MTRAQLYIFVTSLLGGIEIDETIFYNFLDIAQMQLEGVRPWVKIRGYSSGLTASVGTTFNTSFALATDFNQWYDEEASIQLIDSNNSPLFFVEVPYDRRFQYRNANGRFAVDYSTNLFYIFGTITQSYTILQSYIKVPDLVSADATNSWVFPVRFHPMLGLLVAAFWRHGVDYDVFNNPMADKQIGQALAMLDVMKTWDSNLQASMQRGKDPFDSNSIGPGSANGGFVSMG